jgi:CubicO group peptidase (beta-lactamase class C family)
VNPDTSSASTEKVEVGGWTEPGFEPVVGAFVENFEKRGDVGAACSVYLDGQPVVDIWGGLADLTGGRQWSPNTLAVVFSTTKGATAICAHMLVQRGEIDVDAPIAYYWPEFAAAGKGRITVRQILGHRAGLAHVDGDLTLDEVLAWDPVVDAIAAQKPNWEPGTAHGYHMRSFGWIVGEIIRRVDGRSPGQFFADEIAAPLDLDFWIGLPESEEPRVSTIIPPEPPTDPEARALVEQFTGPDTFLGKVMSGPSGLFAYDDMWNTRPLHAAELPSSNGVADARSVARMYAATVGDVDGVRLLEPRTIAAACEVQSDGPDKVILYPMRFGLGFILPPGLGSTGPRAFGHAGAGGSLGFADPERKLGFGYVMNRMELGPTAAERASAIVDAMYDCLL